MTKPCDACPFLKGSGFAVRRLKEFASGAFPCHKTAALDDDDQYRPKAKSLHCAGALIFNEKRGYATQMMRIAERLGMYDHTKLDMTANVGTTASDFRKGAA